MFRTKYYLQSLVLMLALLLASPALACGGDARQRGEITATGVVKKQGITTYMYGSHVIQDDATGKTYALRSSGIDLDRFIDQKVTVRGTLVPEYPVDGGPDYLEVISAEQTNMRKENDDRILAHPPTQGGSQRGEGSVLGGPGRILDGD